MNKKFFLIFFLGIFQAANAQQFPSELWHDGRAILIDGDTIRGQIKYDLDNNAIQIITPHNSMKTFSAYKVHYFEIFDKTASVYREFYSLPYEINNDNYEAPVFFEALQKGKLTLICREQLVQQTRNQFATPYRSPYNITYTVLVYNYFILEDDGTIRQMGTRRKDLLEEMKRHSNKMEDYIRKNNLRLDRRVDLIKVFAYYNSLEAGNAKN